MNKRGKIYLWKSTNKPWELKKKKKNCWVKVPNCLIDLKSIFVLVFIIFVISIIIIIIVIIYYYYLWTIVFKCAPAEKTSNPA